MTDPCWHSVAAGGLAQGELLPGCYIPVIRSDFSHDFQTSGRPTVDVDLATLIVMTQSCDLENGKAPLVACCPVHAILDFERTNPSFARIGEWERVRQGRVEGLHLLPSPTAPDDKWAASVVDFRSIFSLPAGYLSAHAAGLPVRWRLRPPLTDALV